MIFELFSGKKEIVFAILLFTKSFLKAQKFGWTILNISHVVTTWNYDKLNMAI